MNDLHEYSAQLATIRDVVLLANTPNLPPPPRPAPAPRQDPRPRQWATVPAGGKAQRPTWRMRIGQRAMQVAAKLYGWGLRLYAGEIGR